MRFTTEEAYEASECGEPIMLSPAAAWKILKQHDGEPPEAFYADHPECADREVDAAIVLGWLGC